jgi:hypothetical protein
MILAVMSISCLLVAHTGHSYCPRMPKQNARIVTRAGYSSVTAISRQRPKYTHATIEKALQEVYSM